MRIEHFQLIDRVVSVSPEDNLVRAEATVPVESTIFEGHFPGHPIMPGVLLIESMAQTSGYLLLALYRFERMPFLAGVREAKLRSFVEPGRKLDVEARVVHDGSGFAVTAASVKAEGRKICDAELTFRALPFPSADLKAAMRAHAARLGVATEAA